jgi:hypothetical protein
VGQGNPSALPFGVRTLVVDPSNTSIVYAGTGGGFGVYKTTDGGVTF